MSTDEMQLIMSDKCKSVLVDGYRFEVEIYRLDNQDQWTLEVVDFEEASYVWDDKFSSDQAALDVAVETLNNEGALGFMGKEQKP
ncbi:hypothetical protein [uncultured Ruegeria sp.]|uniref:hypothetical protein n=1 Tax=uncultured Ruegeria sp. TaxID=259304 RepID=UPI00260860F1|nr:hypothetical protein [uncultured Ruegeria sp.]